MAIYYSLYALLILAAIFQTNFVKDQCGKRVYCFFSFFIIFSVLAFRHPSMGVDLQYGKAEGYLGMFEIIGNSSWDKVLHYEFLNYEKGYTIFCKLISLISNSQQTLLVACAFISISSVSYLIYKYSENCLLSFLVYLGLPAFLMNYSGLRQTVAIAITLFSYIFIRNKKPIIFILTVLLASTLHKSAIVFLAAYPIYYLKAMGKMRWMTVGLLPVVYLLRNPLFSVLSRLFKDDAVPDNNSAVTLFLVFSAVYIFTAIYTDKNNIHNEGLLNLFWVACICQAFGGVYSTAIRVGYYYMIYLMLLIPKVLINIKTKINDNGQTYAVVTWVVYVCFGLFGLYSIYISETSWAMANPYHFFWQVI